MQKSKSLMLAIITLGLVIVSGCGEERVQRFGLSGEVTHDGKPVPAGMIFFEPDASKGNEGPQGFAQIADGKYSTEKFGKGSISGPLIVSITGTTGKDSPTPGRPIFSRYTTSIDLTEESSEFNFEVPVARR